MRFSSDARLRQELHRQNFLALTFDDGPSEELTNRVLDLLQSLKEKATFFVVGDSCKANPGVLKRIEHEGHVIGWHSNSHMHAFKVFPWQLIRDTRFKPDAVNNLINKPKWFRPPYGKLTLASLIALRGMKHRILTWTFDSGDTWEELPSVEKIVCDVESSGGGVVLLHDFCRSCDSANERAEFVLDVTERLILLARRRGWPIITCDGLRN